MKERLWDEVKVDKMFIIYYHKHCWKMPNSCCDSIKKKKKIGAKHIFSYCPPNAAQYYSGGLSF